MSNNKQQHFEHIEYGFKGFGVKKLLLISSLTLILTFIFYFPVTKIIKDKIKYTLASNPSCPISLGDIKYTLFPPKLSVPSITIPKKCSPKIINDLKLKRVQLFFKGASFSPFGPHFLLQSTLGENKISALMSLGITEQKILMKNNIIKLNELDSLFSVPKLAGQLKLNTSFTLSSNTIKELQLSLNSSDMQLPAQKISNFNLPNLDLGKLIIRAESEKNKINIKNFVLGHSQSPVRVQAKGDLKPNYRSFAYSAISLKTELAFSDSFSEDFALIDMLMARFDKKDNFYQVQLKGTLASPIFK